MNKRRLQMTQRLLGVALCALTVSVLAAPDAPPATLTEWQLPFKPGEYPHSDRKVFYSASCRCAYYSVPARNRIGRLDLATNTVTEWRLPDNWGGPFFLRPSADGTVFYTTRGEAFGRLDPATGTITQWVVPRDRADPDEIMLYELDEDTAGDVWIMGNTNHKIYRLNPTSNVVTTYLFPHDEPYSTNLRVDSEGQVWWLGSRDTNSVAVLDPKTNLYTEWPIPTWVPDSPEASKTGFPKGLSTNQLSRVFFFEKDGNKLGRLDTETNRITEWPIPTRVDAPWFVFGPPSAGVQELVADGTDTHFYFAEAFADKLAKLDVGRQVLTEWPLPPADIPDERGLTHKFPMGIARSEQDEIFYVTARDGKLGRLTFNP